MTRYFDLSHRIENQMTYFPGDPQPLIQPAKGVNPPWRVSDLHLGSHTGTHLDAAAHFLPGGKTIDQYPLQRFLLAGMVAFVRDLQEDEAIASHQLVNALSRIPKGGALIIRTDWDQYWGEERYNRHPYLSPEAARSLASHGIGLVGMDSLNVDSTVQGADHVHAILLGSDVLIVENLHGLAQLEENKVYQFSFLPLLLPGVDGSPVRAVAWED
jgi:arylformamidase